MATINSILNQAMNLRQDIDRLLRASSYYQFDDLSGLEIDYEDSEQLFLLDELRGVMERLADVEDTLRYIAQPVLETARLRKNASGRYETPGGRYFCCGNLIEALVSDSRHDTAYWTLTSVEYNGEDYCLAGHRDVPMSGLTIRIKKAL